MICDTPFSLIYEDTDDSIHLINARAIRRQSSSEVVTPLTQYTQTHNIYNNNNYNNEILMDKKKRKGVDDDTNSFDNIMHKRRRFNDGSICTRNLKRTRIASDSIRQKIPDIIIEQAHLEKSNLGEIFHEFDQLEYIPSNSNSRIRLNRLDLNSTFKTTEVPILMFFFDCSNMSYLKLLNQFSDKNIKIIGITPTFNYINNQSFPIILDERGHIAKLLNLRNPVGGGIFPIPSILLFDSTMEEVFRIKLGYDYNLYYDSSIEKNLQSVLVQAIDYIIHLPKQT